MRVRKTFDEKFTNKIRRTKGCWYWTGYRGAQGYGRAPKVKEGFVLAHRIMYLVTYGDFPRDLCVCHRCDNPSCVRPDHLFLGTNRDNTRDRDRKRRGKLPNNSGERHGHSKLTDAQVIRIRELYSRGTTQKTLSSWYGIGRDQISRIVTGKRWKHLLSPTKEM